MPSTSPRATEPVWQDISQQFEHHLGAVLLAAVAVALLLIVSFIGVLQGAVQRGELLRAQQHLAANSVQAAKAAPLVVVARNGR